MCLNVGIVYDKQQCTHKLFTLSWCFSESWWKNDYALDLNGENENEIAETSTIDLYARSIFIIPLNVISKVSCSIFMFCVSLKNDILFFRKKMLFYKQKPKCVKVLINIVEFFSFKLKWINKMLLFRRWLLNKDVSLIFTRQRNKDEPVICEQ